MQENNREKDNDNVFLDIDYICDSTLLITESLRNGSDITQLPSGDIIVTETKIINTLYTWDRKKGKMIKINQNLDLISD